MFKGNKKQMDEAILYGRNFGLIFQATDDLLDSIGSQKKLGKNVKKDLMKNKGSIMLFKNETGVKKYCFSLAENATGKSKIFNTDDCALKELIFTIINSLLNCSKVSTSITWT